MNCRTIGLDLAKQVFQIHGVDELGNVVLRKQLPRHQLAAFFANLPPCLVGMAACGSAHFWARKLVVLGHAVKLMAPQFVKPYVKGSKTDAADAEAICEATDNGRLYIGKANYGNDPSGSPSLPYKDAFGFLNYCCI